MGSAPSTPAKAVAAGSARLCSGCQRLFQHWDDRVKSIGWGQSTTESSTIRLFPYDTDVPTWISSSHDACSLCSSLLRCMTEDEIVRIKKCPANSKFQVSLHKNILNFSVIGNDWEAPLFYEVHFPARTKAVPVIHLEVSTGSDTSLEFAKGWLNNRLASHESCRRLGEIRPPTRLIEVFEDDIRLCHTKDMDCCPAYLTLSHCWGRKQSVKLLKSNLDSFSENINQENLCKTFQDVLTVARFLEIHYVWIDSLCIVQDDLDDWRKESALMGNVYGNATVNVAATHAKDGSGGLFIDRDVSKVPRNLVQLPRGEFHEVLDPDFYERCLTNAPLASRAWTFQERYLAQRTIHFSSEQIFCECTEHTVCESFPDGILASEIQNSDFRFPITSVKSVIGWNDVICLYSRTQLTFSKDKLIALSGIARHFANKTEARYLAGLWQTNLEQQLCWRVDNDKASLLAIDPTTNRDPSLYIAPSWSWASLDLPITWKLNTWDNVAHPNFVRDWPAAGLFPVASAVRANVSPAGDDPLGELADASLKVVCGPLMRSNIISDPYDMGMFARDNFICADGISIKGAWYANFDGPSRPINLEKETCYLLPLVQRPQLPRKEVLGLGPTEFGLHTIYGLLVKQMRRPGHFARLGVFELMLGETILFQLFDKLSNHSGALMDESFYSEILEETNEQGTKQYVITLV